MSDPAQPQLSWFDWNKLNLALPQGTGRIAVAPQAQPTAAQPQQSLSEFETPPAKVEMPQDHQDYIEKAKTWLAKNPRHPQAKETQDQINSIIAKYPDSGYAPVDEKGQAPGDPNWALRKDDMTNAQISHNQMMDWVRNNPDNPMAAAIQARISAIPVVDSETEDLSAAQIDALLASGKINQEQYQKLGKLNDTDEEYPLANFGPN